jgi:hypothetical protein
MFISERAVHQKPMRPFQEMRVANPGIGDEKLLPFVADPGDLRALKAPVEKFLGPETRLDILVNNAAL